MLPLVLSDQIRRTLVDYLRTSFRFRNADLDRALFRFLQDPDRGMFRGPYLDVRLPFRQSKDGDPVPLEIKPPFPPYAHQLRAWERLSSRDDHQPESTLVVTGTGSGKTECFLYPLLDHCEREHQAGRKKGIKAIILYPMNALASDQAERIAKELWNNPRLKGKVSAGLYVGGGSAKPQKLPSELRLIDDRDMLRQSPPDILLTNYRMLDFLLMRPADGKLWQHNGPDTLQYLVLDELHTYDGAQGSDVACLIRRLRERLGTPPEHLCCVGTSATIGGGGDEPRRLLLRFASDVFGASFGDDAIVGEDRKSLDEALPPDANRDEFPDLALDEHGRDPLDPGLYRDQQAYVDAQAQIWLGHDASDPVALQASLRDHDFLRVLLRALHDRGRTGPQHLADVCAAIPEAEEAFHDLPPGRQQLALISFASLVSHARRREGERIVPMLQVQVQYWIRELRHLVRRVDDKSLTFEWRDEIPRDETQHYLPIVYCRECGRDGLGATQREGEDKLQDDGRAIGEAYLHRRRSARFVVLGEDARPKALEDGQAPEQLELQRYLCGRCLRYNEDGSKCSTDDCPGKMPAQAHAKLSERKKFLADCPHCGGSDCLSVLGSRAASLSSVAISHLFLSPYNDDRKLLAFSDSVQDASHRAGFFAGRTFRFGLRTAIQDVLEKGEGSVPLTEFADRLITHWGSKLPERTLMATFMAPDLREHPDYAKYAATVPGRTPTKAARERAFELLKARLGWEVTREYGLGVVVGRSLENTGASTLAFPPEALQQAGRDLATMFREERPAQFREPPSAETVTHFLEGLLYRQRRRGGIYDGLLGPYARKGTKYSLSKKIEPRLSPTGRQLPRFWALAFSHRAFDLLYSKPTQTNWSRDWAARALSCEVRDEGLNEVLRRSLAKLVDVGIVQRLKSGKEEGAAIDPTMLSVTRDVGSVHCGHCGTEALLSVDAATRWRGRACPVFRCRGLLEAGRAASQVAAADYYRLLYKSGRVERIFAAEHTGLLARDNREEVERRFKADGEARWPDAPNLLTCTPTLEMGIDIGDLSSVMLCSVPPLAANYLQRVGRAGRKTGNALVLTVANARPHDQYFYAEPKEMMAGDVTPPGCFLDAPEMLARQMTAYAMDRWALDETDALNQIPNRTSLILGNAGEERWPGCFYRYYAEHRDDLTTRFLELFEANLSPDNVAKLQEFAAVSGPATTVRQAIEAVRAERDQLDRQIKGVKARLEQIEADPSLAEGESNDPLERLASEREALNDAKRSFVRLKNDLAHKYPLAVLTDAGALPNYAFPETGVTLKSILQGLPKPDKVVGDTKPDKSPGRKRTAKRAAEYLRPASAALKEFAPFNTFYAEGHKVKVTQLDLGTASQPLTETWRLCPSCDYIERVAGEQEPAANCPGCGHEGWGDAGQRRTLVHFRRALSVMNLLDAATDDSTDDRQIQQYRTQELIDVRPNDHSQGAWHVDDENTTFGFELLTGLTIREVNFGLQGVPGLTFRVGGNTQVQDGFLVCRHCGRVQQSRSGKPEHAAYCKVRMGKAKEKYEDVYLYREMKSEALRILLPMSDSVDLEYAVPTFRAALHLGLRKHFHGTPAHLKITESSEPVDDAGNARRRFLLIYDAVPGGTGYLADLWRDGALFGVLQLALDAMRTCRCKKLERDGCYRCVFAYQEQRDIGKISRTRAETLFAQILASRGKVAKIPTLSEVSVDRVLESELEERFVQALARWVHDKPGWSWEADVPYELGRCWRIITPERTWRLEPQVNVGTKDGVTLHCRPDFLLRSLSNEAILPIAIFCDGFRYHACPEKKEARIEDDIRKRQALLDSDKFWVWTVTWKDVVQGEGAGSLSTPTLFSKIDPEQRGKAALAMPGPTIDAVEGHSCLQQLFDFLGNPDADAWRNAALAAGFGLLAVRKPLAVADIQALRHHLEESAERGTVPTAGRESGVPAVFAASRGNEWAHLLGTLDGASARSPKSFGNLQFLLRLFDEPAARKDPEFEACWRAFFQAWNLLQFHRLGTEVVSSEWIAKERGSSTPVAQAESPIQRRRSTREMQMMADAADDRLPGAFRALIDDFPEAKDLLLRLHDRGIPPPDELEGIGDREIEVEAILGWLDDRIAVCLEIGDDDRRVWKRHGWQAYQLDEIDTIADAVAAALSEKGSD